MILNPRNLRKEREGRTDRRRKGGKGKRNCLPYPRLSLFRPLLCLYSSSDLWEEMKDKEPSPTNRNRGALLKREVKSKIYSLRKSISVKNVPVEIKKNSESRFRMSL